MKYAHPAAGRYDSAHGDEDQTALTAEQSALISMRADEIIAERLADPTHFRDLMSGIDSDDYGPQLCRALRHLDAACQGRGDVISRDAVLTALSQIQRIVKDEARRIWLDEAVEQAEREVIGVADEE